MTKIVNIFGAPGSGKSTVSSGVFYNLKTRGISCELVREYIKKWAWENREIRPLDQIYIFAKQMREEFILYGKVDVIITDSPIFLSGFYEEFYSGNKICINLAKEYIRTTPEHRRMNFALKREFEYSRVGRFQNESESLEIENRMISWLSENEVTFEHLKGPSANAVAILTEILLNSLLKN